MIPQQSEALAVLSGFLAGHEFRLLIGCVLASAAGLAVARVMRLDSIAARLFGRRISRTELVAGVEELTVLAARDDRGAMMRLAHRCPWPIFRSGVELLMNGAQPPEIAARLEHTAASLRSGRTRLLNGIAGLCGGLVILPVGILVANAFSLYDEEAGPAPSLAAACFVVAVVLFLAASTARWLADQAEQDRSAHTLETEAFIFALSAIRGGAPSDDVRQMTSLVLGLETPQAPLKIAA